MPSQDSTTRNHGVAEKSTSGAVPKRKPQLPSRTRRAASTALPTPTTRKAAPEASPAPGDVVCSLFRGIRRAKVDECCVSWPEFVAGFEGSFLDAVVRCPENPAPAQFEAAKKALTGFVLAKVDRHRSDETTGEHTALAIDVDALPNNDLAALLERASELRCIVYETVSSTPDAPRVRVIAALGAPLPVTATVSARRALAEALELDPDVCGTASAIAHSQVMFAGGVEHTPPRQFWSFDGEVWAPPATPAALVPRRVPKASPTPRFAASEAGEWDFDAVPDLSAVAAAVAPAGHDSDRHTLVRSLGGYLSRRGFSPAKIAEAVRLQIPSDRPDERAEQARDAAERVRRGEDAPGWTALETWARTYGNGQTLRNLERACRDPREPEGFTGVWSKAWARYWPRFYARFAKVAANDSEPTLDVEITPAAIKSLRTSGEARVIRDELGIFGHVKGATAVRAAVRLLCKGFPTTSAARVLETLRGSLAEAGMTEDNALEMIRAERTPALEVVAGPGTMQQVCEHVAKTYSPRLNELTSAIEVDDGLWEDWRTTEVRIECEREGISEPDRPLSESLVHACVVRVARQNSYDPVRDYLDGLPAWDDTARIDELFTRYMRCEETPLNRALGACFMIGAVARIYEPGCKADLMPILFGEQGGRKSTAIKTLAGGVPMYSDAKMNVEHRSDAYQAMGECWIYEIGEMHGLDKASQSAVKNMITQTEDRFLPPYGRTRVSRARRSVLIGTTNEEDCLRDTTGNRRHPVLSCEATIADPIDVAPLATDRDQLWAEALHRYRAGEQWHLTPELEAEAEHVGKLHLPEDPWQERITDWAKRAAAGRNQSVMLRGKQKNEFTAGDLLTSLIGIDPSRQERGHQTRVGNVLRKLGIRKRRTKTGTRYALPASGCEVAPKVTSSK